jgi:hypothetical protein
LPELDPDRSSFLPEISKGLAQEWKRACAEVALPTAPSVLPASTCQSCAGQIGSHCGAPARCACALEANAVAADPPSSDGLQPCGTAHCLLDPHAVRMARGASESDPADSNRRMFDVETENYSETTHRKLADTTLGSSPFSQGTTERHCEILHSPHPDAFQCRCDNRTSVVQERSYGCPRGRPPLRPLIRAAVVLAALRTMPPRRPISLIQRRVPNTPARTAGM